MKVFDLGLLDYQAAWDRQLAAAEDVAGGAEDALLMVEHPSVLTLGASFHAENLLFSADEYKRRGIEVVRTDRGGDVTFHGPGQLVLYPVFDITRHGKDLHKWMRELEQTMLDVAAEFGLQGRRFPPHTGVWIADRKIAAIGVKVRRWINLHGIALNCVNDLQPFEWIIPCGIQGYGVTSLSQELNRAVSVAEVKPAAIRAFETVFGEPRVG